MSAMRHDRPADNDFAARVQLTSGGTFAGFQCLQLSIERRPLSE